MGVTAIIPARFASSRLPGKPLELLEDKPMIQWVWERCQKANLDDCLVATDDERIASAVQNFGGQVQLTSSLCRSGTERCAEVVRKVNTNPDQIILNVQGDEPFLHPEHLNLLSSAFGDPQVRIATLAVPIKEQASLFRPHTPKVIINRNNDALYFSRHAIPFYRDRDEAEWLSAFPYRKHIGVYAYRASVLLELALLPESSLEIAESLEQLRWLDHGYNIRVVMVQEDTRTIDTPEDLEAARDWLRSNPTK